MTGIRTPLGALPPNTATNAPTNESDASPAKSSKKRKSMTDTEAVENHSLSCESRKKARVTPSPEPSAAHTANKRIPAAPPPEIRPEDDILDVSCIIDTDPDTPIAVFDTCDTVRRKIRALFANPKYPKITQVAFLRAIVKAAYGEDSTKTIGHASLGAFLKKKRPLEGNTSTVYYAAYIYFEKLRIKQGKPKSTDREIMEDIWAVEGGVDIKRVASSIGYYTLASAMGVTRDKYGRVVVVY